MRYKSEKISLQQSEKDILGFTPADVGEHLLKAWNLPVFLQEVVGNHHQPEKNFTFSKETSIVHVADHIVNTLALGDSGESPFPCPMNRTAWKKIELPQGISREKLGVEINKHINSALQVFLQAA